MSPNIDPRTGKRNGALGPRPVAYAIAIVLIILMALLPFRHSGNTASILPNSLVKLWKEKKISQQNIPFL